MEKYAFYLVGAYGVFALVIAIELIGVRGRLRRARERIRALAAR
jgi:heme exporter protein CcmD